MKELALDALAHRINRLEHEVRRWRLGATILLIFTIAVLVMGQAFPKPQVIETQRFILKSPDGKVLAILGHHRPGWKAPLAGEGEQWFEYLRPDLKTWGLHIFSFDGKYRAGLMSDQGQGGSLWLLDQDTASSATLGVGPSHASLSLSATTQSHEEWDRRKSESAQKFNAAKTLEEKAEALQQPSPDTEVALVAHKEHTSLTLKEQGTSHVVLGRIELEKPQGIIEKRPLSSLVLFDRNGKVLWKVP